MIGLTLTQAKQLYVGVMRDNDRPAMRLLCQTDLFFLLYVGCKRKDADHPWIYDRCNEVQASPNGHIDLWAREHYKSTIITFAKTIQDILLNPEITIGIFSHTRPIAKSFLKQIKRELEDNEFLKDLFPEILWASPAKESPQWSLDDGIIVKRQGNPNAATIEAWGLVDGQPTSKHYLLRIYDDVVTEASITSPEMINKTTDAWALSINLGARGGWDRTIGTRYHFGDTYRVMLDRGSVVPRIYPATHNGKFEGNPILLDRAALNIKRRDMGPYVFGCQMLQDPVSDTVMGFKQDWLRQSVIHARPDWIYWILVDPANEKKKKSDYTAMLVIATAPDQNYYLVDGIRDRLNLAERTRVLFELHRLYRPRRVGYEKYGKDSDISHIEGEMDREGYHFAIESLGGSMSKPDRIKRLVPTFEQGRWWMPYQLLKKDWQGMTYDLVKVFIQDELLAFPVSSHDDVIDCASRIHDPEMGVTFPSLSLEADPLHRAVQQVANSKYDAWG